MESSSLKFVIVGHVDHGKSTLIGRLLYDTNSLSQDKIEEIKKTSKDLGRKTEFSYLLDHLEEERRQGITIDTTQVFFRTEKREYVIIDAPGHVEFVRNMITGASQAEAAVLIIDTKEGVKEQSKRHAYILSLLGLKQVIVVLNKMDLVDFKEDVFNKIKKTIEDFLAVMGIAPVFYIPICAIEGENIVKPSVNMPWYKGPTFLESLDILKNKKSLQHQPLIFPIQDIYKIDDKRIAVGRVEGGSIKKDQTINVFPGSQSTKVKSIEKYLERKNEAYSGESIGITTRDSLFINRGDIICDSQKGVISTDNFKANIFWISNKEFNKDDRIIIRCSTQETTCRLETIVKRIDSSTLEIIEKDASILHNLDVAEVVIRTKKPIVIMDFNENPSLGRFVLVRNENICAGGIIATIK